MSRNAATEERLRALLREAPVPDAEEAGRRGLALVEQAFSQRPRERRSPLPRLALAFAVATLLAALLLSPAGATVRDWVGDVFEDGVPDAERGLSRIPGGGRLLVQSAQGPWVVQPDGSRRLLGDYDEAGWSPRGLFVATASGRTLSAVEPDGTPHWSLPAPGQVRDPRWSPSGFQIAYRARPQLRVVAGDGTEDRLLDPAVAPLPPTWSPWGTALLAYVDTGARVRVVATQGDTPGPTDRPGAALDSAPALGGITSLEWSPAGGALLEASGEELRLRPLALRKALSDVAFGPARRLPLPAGAALDSAVFSPDGNSIAVLLRHSLAGTATGDGNSGAGPRSEVVLIDLRNFSRHRLFAVSGRLTGLAWSPDGDRLLTSWPQADQWLFLATPPHPGARPAANRIRAVGHVAAEFAPGAHIAARFPRIAGWCCH